MQPRTKPSSSLPPARRRSRRGVAAVLAMLYLILFSVLAIGFYAATTSAVQVVANERRAAMAQMAAESGMDFIRYHLSHITIPHGTQPADLFNVVFDQLEDRLEYTGNLTTICNTAGVIQIPCDASASGPDIALDASGSRFRIRIENLGAKLRVKVIGRHNDSEVRRAVQMDYGLAEKASAIFDYGVASKGKISTGGSSRIKGATDPKKGSVLSTCLTDATPVAIDGKEVSGDISITNPAGNVTFAGASVGGTTDPAVIAAEHIHKGVPEPEFPTVDSSIFLPFVTNTYTGGSYIENCRIPANTNPKFTAGATIKGVMYVEAPNKIEFRGHSNIHGVIVVENDAPGDLTTNILDFAGTVTAYPVSTLPDSFGDLKKLTGAFILAPNFRTNFTGNFGTIAGSILASQVTMSGNAGGTVVGSVINLEDTAMTVNGSSEIIIASTGTTDYPAGVYFSSHYVPLADTYTEVSPW